MARPTGPSDPEKTRRAILACAERLFATNGFHDTSVAEIAVCAGITAPSLLYHFGTKEGLFEEVIRNAWTEIADVLRPVLAEDLGFEEMFVRTFLVLAEAEVRKSSLFTLVNASFLGGQGVGSRAVTDTLLPLIAELERHLRHAAGDRMDQAAPLREGLIYILLAHSAEQGLLRLDSADFERAVQHEPFFAMAIVKAILEWKPA